MGRACLAGAFGLGGAADGADHNRTDRIEPAGEQLPDAARRGVDEDGLAALDLRAAFDQELGGRALEHQRGGARVIDGVGKPGEMFGRKIRSEEHTSELQSLMRISYAVFCLKKKTNT